MRFLFYLVLIAAIVLGVGAYRGWFHFSSDSNDGKPSITVTMDKDRIRDDKDKAVEKVQNLGQQAKDKVTTTSQKAQD